MPGGGLAAPRAGAFLSLARLSRGAAHFSSQSRQFSVDSTTTATTIVAGAASFAVRDLGSSGPCNGRRFQKTNGTTALVKNMVSKAKLGFRV